MTDESIEHVQPTRIDSPWPLGRSPRLTDNLNYIPLLDSLLDSIRTNSAIGENEQIAFFDAKTGFLNRRFFYLFTERLLRKNETFGLIILDIDLLKAYNTYFGEPQGGDMAIMALSQVLAQSSEETYPSGGPYICRLDGDTFALLFPADQMITSLPAKILALVDQHLVATCLDLGRGTTKFEALGDDDRNALKAYLSQPRITASELRLIRRGLIPDGKIDTVLKEIFGELDRQKEAKRPPKIKELTKRLG